MRGRDRIDFPVIKNIIQEQKNFVNNKFCFFLYNLTYTLISLRHRRFKRLWYRIIISLYMSIYFWVFLSCTKKLSLVFYMNIFLVYQKNTLKLLWFQYVKWLVNQLITTSIRIAHGVNEIACIDSWVARISYVDLRCHKLEIWKQAY